VNVHDRAARLDHASPHHWRTPAFALAAGLASAAAISAVAQADPARTAAALLVLYTLGYVTGSLLVDGRDALSWAIIRLIGGLLLTTIGFLLSLVLSLPWFLGPIALCAAALHRRRWAACALPHPRLSLSVDGAIAGLLAIVILSPILLSVIRMVPGDFPPVFFSVDNAYFMEKVQSLTQTSTYPPESLSNLGGTRTYHYAVHGLAALISRVSGLAPHHALFAIVVPLLTAGILAAAVAAARGLAPALPFSLSVPLLLISVPTFWYPFWSDVIGRLGMLTSSGVAAALRDLTDSYEIWGVASIEGHNVGAHFVVLASLAGIGAAATRGWRLPAFLIGSAIIVKTSAGVALVAGFLLAQAYRALAARRLQPAMPALAAGAIFVATYVAFWVAPSLPPDFSIEWFPLFQIGRLQARGGLLGWAFDLGWVLLPVLIVSLAGVGDPERRSLPLLLLGLAPFIVVNVTRAIDARPGGGGATDDWLQIVSTAAFVLHAYVLSFVSGRWGRLHNGFRVACVLVLALAIAPVAWVAAGYSLVLANDHERGHEFADNRSIAEALAAIPIEGTVVVTNDLRYPAQNFGRTNRQMQIPALYGHQAFAVNYAYETFAFSRDRLELQALLEAEEWTGAIDDAARTHGWTHLLIRKDYMHPASIPLEPIFENDLYRVYRFGEPRDLLNSLYIAD
jgi:hypothetical protein